MGLLAAAGPTFGALAAYTGPPSVAHFVWLGAMSSVLGVAALCAELEPDKKRPDKRRPDVAGGVAWS
jgi:hypothetical protein